VKKRCNAVTYIYNELKSIKRAREQRIQIAKKDYREAQRELRFSIGAANMAIKMIPKKE